MATENKKASAIFPNYPRGAQVVNPDGTFTPAWHQTFGSLFQALQRNWKSEGISAPVMSEANINNLETYYTTFVGKPLPQNVADISGQIVYDSDNNALKIFVITFTNTNPKNVATVGWKTFNVT